MSGAKHKRPIAPPGRKGNPYLAQIAAAYEEREQQALRFEAEISRMALARLLHERLDIGPGRAPGLMDEFMSIKNSIAARLLEESKDDPEVLVYKRDWATYLRGVFGKSWNGCREYFQYLRDYW